MCLNCGGGQHDGDCLPKCINCSSHGHSCRSKECPIWKKEKEICAIKTRQDISYAHARRLYETNQQQTPPAPYATVLQAPPDPPALDTSLQDRVDALEKKVDKMLSLLSKLANQAGVRIEEEEHPRTQTPDTENSDAAHRPSMTPSPQDLDGGSDDGSFSSLRHSVTNMEDGEGMASGNEETSQELGKRGEEWKKVGNRRGRQRGRARGAGRGARTPPDCHPSLNVPVENVNHLEQTLVKRMPSLTRKPDHKT